ncbi:MAG: hypothetical protein AB3N28_06630 [Kordiimonas sp.]
MTLLHKYSEWIAAILIVLILAGSLPFKFTGHPMPTHIFNIVGEFLGLGFMKTHGAIIIGVVELISCILVLIPAVRAYGGLLTAGTMAGAIFFHLFSPLGVTVTYVENGVAISDGTLFYTAIIAMICGLFLAYKRKDSLPIIGQN